MKAPFGTAILRDIYRKPIVNDEINYEGDIDSRWGRLTGEEMTFRFWNAVIGGGYATHGETYKVSEWISYGGVFNRLQSIENWFFKKDHRDKSYRVPGTYRSFF